MLNDFRITLIFLLFGAGGGVLRAFELNTVFERDTGLAVAWHPLSIALIALSVVAAALALVYAKSRKISTLTTYEEAFAAEKRSQIVLPLLAALALGMTVVTAFMDFLVTNSISSAAMSILSAVTAISVLLVSLRLANERPIKRYAIFLILPIFWSCFWLIDIFQLNAADPVVLDYVYMLLAVIFVVLSIYSSVGFNFGKLSSVKTRFFAACAIYFCMVNVLGHLVYMIMTGSYLFYELIITPDFSALIFSVFYCMHILVTLGRNVKPMRLVS